MMMPEQATLGTKVRFTEEHGFMHKGNEGIISGGIRPRLDGSLAVGFAINKYSATWYVPLDALEVVEADDHDRS